MKVFIKLKYQGHLCLWAASWALLQSLLDLTIADCAENCPTHWTSSVSQSHSHNVESAVQVQAVSEPLSESVFITSFTEGCADKYSTTHMQQLKVGNHGNCGARPLSLTHHVGLRLVSVSLKANSKLSAQLVERWFPGSHKGTKVQQAQPNTRICPLDPHSDAQCYRYISTAPFVVSFPPNICLHEPDGCLCCAVHSSPVQSVCCQ